MSNNVILSVENVSKLYRLGTVGTGTFGGDVQRFWKTKILGQEDPFLKVGQTNDRTSKEKADFVWALQDINFEVKRGEVLGIIGKNGAGKSTLLKLLSRITSPTTGSIKSAGRMASLLEVGTGFHPELTGRENIFLNGAILGMTKKEIQSKFDEIVDFSGCELYIDTPTKRYSSGMTVRLGFAVAAFLDPEILVVDEVLAVGDAEFQKKALGKMDELSSGGGRTILFVSHNMEAVRSICDNVITMKNGTLIDNRSSKSLDYNIDEYLREGEDINKSLEFFYDELKGIDTNIRRIAFTRKSSVFKFDEDIEITIEIDFIREVTLSVEVLSISGQRIFLKETKINVSGVYVMKVEKCTLCFGQYSIIAHITIPNVEYIQKTDTLNFDISSIPKEFLHYSNQANKMYPLGYLYFKDKIFINKAFD